MMKQISQGLAVKALVFSQNLTSHPLTATSKAKLVPNARLAQCRPQQFPLHEQKVIVISEIQQAGSWVASTNTLLNPAIVRQSVELL